MRRNWEQQLFVLEDEALECLYPGGDGGFGVVGLLLIQSCGFPFLVPDDMEH